MRIYGPGSTGGIQNGKAPRRPASGSPGFSLPDLSEKPRAQSAGATRSVAGVDAILALQGVEDAVTGRRRAIRRGHDMLDALEDIRLDLIAGIVPRGRLVQLIRMVARHETSGSDPLDAVLAEIDLRARVELAKLGHFIDS